MSDSHEVVKIKKEMLSAFILEKVDYVNQQLRKYEEDPTPYEDDWYYYESYLPSVNQDLLIKLADAIKHLDHPLNLDNLSNLMADLADREPAREPEEKNVEIGRKTYEVDGTKDEIIVMSVSKEEWSFMMTFDFIDWEIHMMLKDQGYL